MIHFFKVFKTKHITVKSVICFFLCQIIQERIVYNIKLKDKQTNKKGGSKVDINKLLNELTGTLHDQDGPGIPKGILDGIGGRGNSLFLIIILLVLFSGCGFGGGNNCFGGNFNCCCDPCRRRHRRHRKHHKRRKHRRECCCCECCCNQCCDDCCDDDCCECEPCCNPCCCQGGGFGNGFGFGSGCGIWVILIIIFLLCGRTTPVCHPQPHAVVNLEDED